MAHVVEGKQKLLNRVRRLRGQIDALERALDADEGCSEVMRLLTASRGAINGIMAEVVEDHILMHMHAHSIDPFRHDHDYLGKHHERNERKTWGVIALCGAMMVAEVVGGLLFVSMALLADGLHMSTHGGALLIAALAYTYARRHALDRRFAFGTGKLGELAAYSSALILAMIAVLIGYESVSRLLNPVHISFDQALPIAALGLYVNLLSAWLLRDDHDHGHGHTGHR